MTARRRVTAKDGAAAIGMLDSEKRAVAKPAADTATLRKCVGSARFGIEAHQVPPADFPVHPARKDGLGTMCKTHWKAYVQALTRDRKAAKVADAAAAPGIAKGVFTSSGPRQARRTRPTVGEQIVDAVDAMLASAPPISNQQRRAAAWAAGKVPAADGSMSSETPAVTTRRAKFEARVAEVGVASDEGQQMLETTEEAPVETVAEAETVVSG